MDRRTTEPKKVKKYQPSKGKNNRNFYAIFTARTPISRGYVDSQKNTSSDEEETPTPKRKRVQEGRGRTPSGQILTGKVGDVKSILFQNLDEVQHDHCQIKVVTEPLEKSTVNCCESASHINDSGHHLRSWSSVNHNINNQDTCSFDPNKVGLLTADVLIPTKNTLEVQDTTILNCEETYEHQTPPQTLHTIEEVRMPDTSVQHKDSEAFKSNMAQPSQDTSNLEGTMDVRTVMAMFNSLRKEIKDELTEMKADIQAINYTGEVTEESKKKMAKVMKVMENYDESEEKKRWVRQNRRNTVQEGAMHRLDVIVSELQNRIEKLELQNAKRTLVISGFYASEKRNVCRQQLEHFFSNNMEIQVNIEDLYFMGDFSPPNIVVILQSQAEKKLVFKNIGKIKTFVNKDDRKIIFKDYLMPMEYEKRHRQDEVLQDNEERENKQDISFQGRNMLISGFSIPNQVQVPDPTTVLQMKEEELDKIWNLPIKYGPQLFQKGNTILAATIEADDFQSVNNAYLAIKLRFAGARHIVAAWNFPTNFVYDGQDYKDDDEHGMGRFILNLMIRNDISHRVIFAIRHCGEKLQKERFTMYEEAIMQLLKQYPHNNILQHDQQIKRRDGEPDMVENQQNPRGRGHNRGRGGSRPVTGGRGRGRGRGRIGHNYTDGWKKQKGEQNKTKFSPISEQTLIKNRQYQTLSEKDAFGGNYAAALSSRTNTGDTKEMET